MHKKEINALLMLNDFEKTFYLTLFKFMYKVLNHFNFSNEFIKWITMFNAEITSTVYWLGFSQLKDFVSWKIQ